MEFKEQTLAAEGFQGFMTFRELRSGRLNEVPKHGGVYVVLREIDTPPVFLDNNPGGRFKGRNPTVNKTELNSNWVNEAHVIYIGKGDQLQRRMTQFINFGAGKPIGHWGGRLVWQIENSEEFVVAWKRVDLGETAASLESQLLQEFIKIYGRLPFANLRL